MSNKVVKQVKPYSLAQLNTVAFSFVGLVLGVIYAVGGLISDVFNSNLGGGTILAFFAIPVMPLVLGVIGFVVGGISGFAFNYFSKISGGIEIDSLE